MKKGEITVFLSLMMTVMVGLLFQVIEAARTNGVRFMTECAADMALQSVLAEYNRELLKQYDLFFIDSAYGSSYETNTPLEGHLTDYLDDNLGMGEGAGRIAKDFYNASCESVVITETCKASDMLGDVVERYAVDYMLDLYELDEIPFFSNERSVIEQKGLLGNRFEEEKAKNKERIARYRRKGKKKFKHFSIDNPADAVFDQMDPGIVLTKVTGSDALSAKSIAGSEYVSSRNYEEGDGFLHGETAATKTEDLIFQRYLVERCGNYVTRKNNSELGYELEYVLCGKDSDKDNLDSVVTRLLLIRETANFLYLSCDTRRCAEAEALADTVAAVCLLPELGKIIKWSIILAWSYSEAVNDIRILLSGGKVALMKTDEQWKLGLLNGLRMKTPGGDNASGLTYRDYLQILMLFVNKEERNMRFLDIMEMDVRCISGNDLFRIDRCIHDLEAVITVKSGWGHHIRIERLVGYQK
ncbi:MAG: DUF5702 domain-containing protein [Lachnospiraceae bacterium]|nr:DUF5702 domain-containing protein [Lachnospiraceae bacterium]